MSQELQQAIVKVLGRNPRRYQEPREIAIEGTRLFPANAQIPPQSWVEAINELLAAGTVVERSWDTSQGRTAVFGLAKDEPAPVVA